MNFRIFKISTYQDFDEIEHIKATFKVNNLEDIDLFELAEYLAEEYHNDDIEDYESFEAEESELDTDEIGLLVEADAEDEGYLIYLTPETVQLRYYKRSDYL